MSTSVPAVPVRTCVGCRQRRPKATLLRMVRQPAGRVVADPAGTTPGRGAYVCGDSACVERGLARGRLSHAFRRACEAGDTLAAEVRELWQRRK
jgi:predicted RNA-binding protein YlxR (DUF448 family)